MQLPACTSLWLSTAREAWHGLVHRVLCSPPLPPRPTPTRVPAIPASVLRVISSLVRTLGEEYLPLFPLSLLTFTASLQSS